MTSYSDYEPSAGWEFKIIRSTTGQFGRSNTMRRVLDEEAKAGWELVEKFDDKRLRLRRPMAARVDDRALEVDPYRTWVGVSESGLVVRGLVVSAAIAMTILGIYLVVRM